MKNSSLFILILSLTLFLQSCEDSPFSQRVSDGVIVYKIEYPLIDEDNAMLDLMPKNMEMTISGNDYRTDIIAGMGLFKTSIISKGSQKNITHSVKMLNKKFVSELDHHDIKMINPSLANLEIEFTDNTKTIAGIECKEAKIKDNDCKEYLAYFTKYFKIKNPNKGTPFEKIPGVLMEYEFVNYNTHMKFIAQEVMEKSVEKDYLNLESGYAMVKPRKLKAEIQSIFDKVNN